MTTEQEYLVRLSRAAILDEDPPLPPEDIDWQYLWDKAREQNLSGLLASKVIKLPKEKLPENAHEWKHSMLQTAMLMGDRLDEFERMLEILKENNIEPICVKGSVVKDLYPIPILRTMGDFDVWVEKAQRNEAEAIFEREGYTLDRNTLFSAIDMSGEINSFHWELFESLEDDFRESPAFWNDELRKNVITDNEGRRVLSPTYELAYSVIHASKHFTREGCGLRNLLDVALILRHEIQDIDIDKAYEICASQRYEKIFLYFLSAARKWYGAEFSYSAPLPEPDRFLEYLLSYGVFGRELEGKILAAQVVRREGDDVSAIRRIFFPPGKMIWHKYQYVKKSPLLLPVAWVHRFFTAVFVKKYSIKDMAAGLHDSLEYGQEREAWLNELDIQ